MTVPVLCWKCRDRRTRSHHRRCPKRGNQEQSSDALKRWMLERATRAAAIDAKREAQMTAIERLFATTLPPGVTLSYERSRRAPSRMRRAMDGMCGIMADVAGKAAGETWAHAERLTRDSFLDTAAEAMFGCRREPQAPATYELADSDEALRARCAKWAPPDSRDSVCADTPEAAARAVHDLSNAASQHESDVERAFLEFMEQHDRDFERGKAERYAMERAEEAAARVALGAGKR